MERENIIAATHNRLKQFGMSDFEQYKENTQDQFITIEKYFLKVEERISKALEEIKSINFNIRGVCNAINISKSTVYNNPNTLRLYIEKRIENIEKQELLPKNKQQKTQERMSELEAFLDRAIIDQIEFNNMKLQNEELNAEVNRLAEKIELLSLERANHIKRLNEMELELKRLRNKKGNIVSFNSDKV
jgi:hypothetical protein